LFHTNTFRQNTQPKLGTITGHLCNVRNFEFFYAFLPRWPTVWRSVQSLLHFWWKLKYNLPPWNGVPLPFKHLIHCLKIKDNRRDWRQSHLWWLPNIWLNIRTLPQIWLCARTLKNFLTNDKNFPIFSICVSSASRAQF